MQSSKFANAILHTLNIIGSFGVSTLLSLFKPRSRRPTGAFVAKDLRWHVTDRVFFATFQAELRCPVLVKFDRSSTTLAVPCRVRTSRREIVWCFLQPFMLNSLETDRFHLADIEGRIRDLERLLSSLRIEHALVQERLDAYKYPVITLPSEMVSEIFIHCLPIYPHPPPLIGVDSPTLLAQICRKWRDIALSTPALWRAIQLTSDSTTFLGMCKQGRISEVWMRRSASCPLSINIDSHRSLSWSELSAAVIAHRPRWEHLELTVPTSALLTIVGPMPFLWRLDLGLVPMETIHTIPPIQEVPHLRTVSLRGWIASRVTLPWQKLTSLTLFMADPSQCVTILRQTSNLIHCHLHLDEELEPFIDPGLDIPLPRLESLVLKNHSCVSLTGFLDSFVVPALYSLTMEEEFLGADRILSLKSFISKSGCKLEEVRITLEGATRGKSYLSAFPSIPNFSFIGRYAWNDDDSDFSSD